MVKSSPGIIIVASKNANKAFLPLNSKRENANAARMVITKDNKVDTTPTYKVFKNNLPMFAFENAFL